MSKTRRTKTNKSPIKPYRNAKAFVAVKGDMVKVAGARGRTRVKRVTNEAGKRLSTVRVVEIVPQVKALTPRFTGTVKGAKPIFLGRVYTGVARSKPYPYAGVKRGGPAPVVPLGLMARAGRAMRRVVVGGETGG